MSEPARKSSRSYGRLVAAAVILFTGTVLVPKLLRRPMEWSEKVVQIGSVEQFDRLAGSTHGPLLVDFYATWCPLCHGMAPDVQRVAEEGVRVAVVDIEQLPEVAARYGVDEVPAVVVLRDGRVANQIIGALTLEELRILVQAHDGPG